MANADTQLTQKTVAPASIAKTFPIYAFVAGTAIVAIMLGDDLLGLGPAVAGLKSRLIQVGLAIMALGAAADLTIGQRSLLAWLKSYLTDWQGLLKFLTIAVQLGLLVVIMRLSFLEHNAFYHNVMLLTLYGFIIHYFLPQPYRLPFFLLLSLGGIFGVFGLADGAWLIGLGLALIGICRLPISLAWRAAILIIAGAACIAMRVSNIQTPWNKAIWPIFGSMFMFRLMVYLYDLKHKKVPQSGMDATRTLSYFFLLPNVAFPVFPVVDYGTFCRTYYNDDQYRIYQQGLKWMCWGVVHLLIYRCINYYWIIGPEEVRDTSTLAQYMASNYLFIIRLSGQFHMIVGILHLFGFNLPRIMDLYLLPSSFTDYWRRVNVYWKEFIQKIFYYPAYFRLRRLGETKKLALATAFGFLVTWVLHSYQWFWIRGSFVFSVPDVLFWSTLAVFMLANALYEARHGRQRILVKRAATLGEIASKTLRAAGIFVVMTMLWSLWISPSVSDWLSLLSSAELTLAGVATMLLLITAVIGGVVFLREKWPARSTAWRETPPAFFRLAMPTAGFILVFYFLVQPEFHFRLGPQASAVIADLKTNRLNERDEAMLERGYYENLTNVNLFNSQLWELYARKPDIWLPVMETDAVRKTNDLMKYELLPSFNGSLLDAPFSTNRWGMRDDDCEQTPAPNTYRMALLGGSVEMGSGVVQEETFEYLLEQRLNREPAKRKHEILNFSVAGYHIIQQLVLFENKVLAFKPNAAFFVAHVRDEYRTADYLGEIAGLEMPYDEIKEIMRRAGVLEKPAKAKQLLEPYKYEIMSWAYSRVVRNCRERDILPIWICLPAAPGRKDSAYATELIRVAAAAGFIVLNLTDVYDAGKGAYLQLAPWDKHPNARGQRLIADGLYAALRENEDKIPLGLSAALNLAESKSE